MIEKSTGCWTHNRISYWFDWLLCWKMWIILTKRKTQLNLCGQHTTRKSHCHKYKSFPQTFEEMVGLLGNSSSSLNSGLWNCVYFHPLRPQDSQGLNRKREIEHSILCFCFLFPRWITDLGSRSWNISQLSSWVYSRAHGCSLLRLTAKLSTPHGFTEKLLEISLPAQTLIILQKSGGT